MPELKEGGTGAARGAPTSEKIPLTLPSPSVGRGLHGEGGEPQRLRGDRGGAV